MLGVGGGGRHCRHHGEHGTQGHGVPSRTRYWVKPGRGLKDPGTAYMGYKLEDGENV